MTQITGTSADNLLTGTSDKDKIEGLNGNDILNGLTGGDELYGGDGNDTLILGYAPGDEDDYVDGGGGIDTLIIDFSTANDASGIEYFSYYVDNMRIPDVLIRYTSIERLYVTGTFRNDELRGGIDNDSLNGGAGDDKLVSNGGVDTLMGGDGTDSVIVDFSLVANDQNITNIGISTLTNGTTFNGIEAFDLKMGVGNDAITLVGDYNDTISTTAGNDSVSSGGGNDSISSGAGNDQADGGTGNDILRSDIGDDLLNAGTGKDELYGEDGNDTLILGYAPGDEDDYVDGGQGIDTLIVDLSTANDASGIKYSFYYVDHIKIPDVLIRYTSIERLNIIGTLKGDELQGGTDSDSLKGGAGDDTLNGKDGNDQLIGNRGDDQFLCSAGNDTLIGGQGKDQFIYNTGSAFAIRDIGTDIIKGFVPKKETIVLGRKTFTSLANISTENLSQELLGKVRSDKGAAKSTAFIVYSKKTGNLFYNPNGKDNGFEEGGLFATLQGKPSDITFKDFLIL